eukprot:CAMPEP_0182597074 /NCGR_PEP_ID=MMETSP1324-20130603/85490_1 /TAXON_ID=236786 /ORGANISM="Florenciella sp., Strain RCC1587" /LENGTH=175 /DNA_ID=CAMNT_0024814799 /DNA_START=133 /DNA_END=660 /DNA_ORIENTATION=+
MSRVEGAEKRALLGNQPSRRFEGGRTHRIRASVGGGSEDEGCCNDCLARFCGLRNGAMRYRCCVLIGMFLLLVGAGVGGYFAYKEYSSSSSSDDDSDDDCSAYKNKHLCDSSALNSTSVDTTGSDSERRDTDKAGDGADSLPAGGANTDTAVNESFGARIRRHLRGTYLETATAN